MNKFITFNGWGDEVSRGAIIVAVFSVISRLVGVLRDRFLASTFGAGYILDSYYAAFRLPDLIFNTLVLGALATALIPIFIERREKQGLKAAWDLGNRILNLLTIILVFFVIIGIGLAPYLVKIIAPGFDLANIVLTVKLARIMLLAVVIFGISNLFGSLLQAQQRLIAFAAAPIFYNLGIIAGLFWFVPRGGAIGLAWGVVLGSFLHMLLQLWSIWHLGWRWHPLWPLGDSAVFNFLRLLGPRTLGLMAAQINQIVTVSFISALTVGSLAAYSLALNLHSFPINVFGVSLAVAVFPLLSRSRSLGQHQEFINHFSQNIRRVLFYVIPLSVLFLVLRAQLVRVILGSGAFNWYDTIRTAQVLGFLALAIVSDSLIPLVARTFYALQDTKTPVIAAFLSIIVNLGLLITLKSYGLAGVGLAYIFSSLTNLLVLIIFLGKRLGSLGSKHIINGVWQMSLGSLAAAATAYGTLYLIEPFVNMNTFWGIFIQGLSAGLVGIFSYLAVSLAIGMSELNFVRSWLISAWRVIKNYNSSNV